METMKKATYEKSHLPKKPGGEDPPGSDEPVSILDGVTLDGVTLDGVTQGRCPLETATEIGERCAAVGFDWNSPAGAQKKVEEELQELEEAAEKKGPNEVFWEVGDVLLAAANLARLHGVSPKDALREAIQRFIRRFQAVERGPQKEGLDPKELSLDELERRWQEIKREEALPKA